MTHPKQIFLVNRFSNIRELGWLFCSVDIFSIGNLKKGDSR